MTSNGMRIEERYQRCLIDLHDIKLELEKDIRCNEKIIKGVKGGLKKRNKARIQNDVLKKYKNIFDKCFFELLG